MSKKRISYKDKFNELEKEVIAYKITITSLEDKLKKYNDLKSKLDKCISDKNDLQEYIDTKNINDLKSELTECNHIINTNNTVITSLEGKIGELETTICHLKTKIPKDISKDKHKLLGVRFQNGKFIYNGVEYNSVADIKKANNHA